MPSALPYIRNIIVTETQEVYTELGMLPDCIKGEIGASCIGVGHNYL
jgi:hypothetical protein